MGVSDFGTQIIKVRRASESPKSVQMQCGCRAVKTSINAFRAVYLLKFARSALRDVDKVGSEFTRLLVSTCARDIVTPVSKEKKKAVTFSSKKNTCLLGEYIERYQKTQQKQHSKTSQNYRPPARNSRCKQEISLASSSNTT